jgi:hypothetical protein
MLPGHPDVELMVRADLLLNGYPLADKMLFTEKCVLMRSDSVLHLIAAYPRTNTRR